MVRQTLGGSWKNDFIWNVSQVLISAAVCTKSGKSKYQRVSTTAVSLIKHSLQQSSRDSLLK